MKKILLFILAISIPSIAYATPNVTVSISPLYLITKEITKDILEPELLQQAGSDIHDMALKPSMVEKLNEADIIIIIDRNFEVYLQKQLSSSKANIIEAVNIPTIKLSKDPVDYHIWLDPENALAIAKKIADTLSELDVEHKAKYQNNLKLFQKQIAQVKTSIKQQLSPVQKTKFISAHNAYSYFTDYFNLNNLKTFQFDHISLSFGKYQQAKKFITTNQPVCIFTEKYHPNKTIAKLIDDTKIKAAELDVEHLDSENDDYVDMLQETATIIKNCLADSNAQREYH